MNKKPKTKLLILLGTIFVVMLAIAGCNGSDSDKATNKNSDTTEMKNNVPPPPPPDTTMDSGKGKPIPPVN